MSKKHCFLDILFDILFVIVTNLDGIYAKSRRREFLFFQLFSFLILIGQSKE